MKTTNASNQSQAKSIYTAAVLATLALSTVLFGVVPAKAQSFDNVQLFVTTSSQHPYYYTFTAYNLTGSLVATYQGQYPAASFEVPSGDYLFTVSALYQSYTTCQMCPMQGGGGQTSSGDGKAIPPIMYMPASEYGYVQAHVDGPQTFNINTKNVTSFPTSQVSVKVSFVNGTAASGASVSASVVGQWYYWWGQNSNVSTWAQTGNDGMATLILPQAPVVITAWDWVPVNLPANETTIVTNIGGQDVNVTVYWQPSYVGLSASGLLIPPSTSIDLTLTYQAPNYWVMPGGIEYAQSGKAAAGYATVADQPSGIPSQTMQPAGNQTGQQFYLPQQIPSLQAGSNPGGLVASQGPGLLLPLAAVAAFGLIAVGAIWLALRKQHRPPKA